MARNGFRAVRIRNTMFFYHIRRITGNTVKRSRRKNPVRRPDIAGDNLNFIGQTVQHHASGRHICALRLNLQSGQMGIMVFRLHQQRNNPCTRPQIQQLLSPFGTCKSCQQYCIHTKTELFRLLYDAVAVPLQFIQPLHFLQPDFHRSGYPS